MPWKSSLSGDNDIQVIIWRVWVIKSKDNLDNFKEVVFDLKKSFIDFVTLIVLNVSLRSKELCITYQIFSINENISFRVEMFINIDLHSDNIGHDMILMTFQFRIVLQSSKFKSKCAMKRHHLIHCLLHDCQKYL